MKLGLALSGGGFRATVFHLGTLARLAESGQLEDVTFLSTVSGGSLCVALIHALNDLQWPTSNRYLEHVLPAVQRILTTKDFQRSIIARALRSPLRIFETRADDLSALIQEHWGVTAVLSDLPVSPRWMINATTCETGKNWRWERFRMGDYLFGYSYDTQKVLLADAVASSAGFPGLIGPLVFDTRPYRWFRYKESSKTLVDPETQRQRKTEPVTPDFPVVHLWDGGVYDNHGLEGLHDFIRGWREDIEFFIVSDGAGRAKPERYSPGIKALMRISTGIMMDQVRSLRARAIVERLINHEDPGAFLQAGNTGRYILRQSKLPQEEIDRIFADSMADEEAVLAAEMPTVIRKLADVEFQRLFRHGFEVADYTLYGYHPEAFTHISYSQAKSNARIIQPV
jgi:NTE family protein